MHFASAIRFHSVLLLKSFLEILLVTVSGETAAEVIPLAEIFVILNFESVPNESVFTNNKSTTERN